MLNEPTRTRGRPELRLLLAVVLGGAIGIAAYFYADSQQSARLAARRLTQQAPAAPSMTRVAVAYDPVTQDPAASPLQLSDGPIVTTEISPTNIKVGDVLDIKITVRNTSDKPLQTMGPEPGFVYVQGQTYFTQRYGSDPGKWRVGLGSASLDSIELPYRWGLGGDLAPGATTTVSGHIKITQDFEATNFWVALVNEPSTVVQIGVGMTLVTSLPRNISIVAVDAPNFRSFPAIAPMACRRCAERRYSVGARVARRPTDQSLGNDDGLEVALENRHGAPAGAE